MKIVIDAFGGDYAPLEIVKGAITSVNLLKDVTIVLAGKRQEIENILKEYGYAGNQIEILDASEVITNDDVPTSAIRIKKDSSLVVGLNALKDNDDIVGLISAGSTGAVLSGALFIVGRMDNVLRPALAPTLPTVPGGQTMLIDCGANVDCKPEYLKQFAIMGSVYMKSLLSIDNPKVGLLNIGAEEKKGNSLAKEAFELLKETKEINFVGNVEARQVLSGDVDVIVADGFAGNIALKASEGAVLNTMKLIKNSIKSANIFAKMGAGMLKGVFKEIKNRMDYTALGGSPFLGVIKIVLKTHGTCKAENILACVKQVIQIHNSGYIEKLREGIKD